MQYHAAPTAKYSSMLIYSMLLQAICCPKFTNKLAYYFQATKWHWCTKSQIWGMDLAGVLRRQICNLLTCGTCSSWSILAPNFGWFYQLSLFQLSKRYPENPKYITQEVWGLCLPDIVLRAFGTQAVWYGTPGLLSTPPGDFHPIHPTWRSVSAIVIRF